MRGILGLVLLGLAWLVGMSMLVLALDDLLFHGRLDAWLFWAGAVIASTMTVEPAEEVDSYRHSASKSISLLPPSCHGWPAQR
jgi:hypothetical protein